MIHENSGTGVDEDSVLNGVDSLENTSAILKQIKFGILSYIRPPSAMILLYNRFNKFMEASHENCHIVCLHPYYLWVQSRELSRD